MVTFANRVKQSVTAVASSGTGTLTLGSAAAGFQGMADVLTTGATTRYLIEGPGDAWEIGAGIWTASGATLSRAPSESSNSGNAITATTSSVVSITVSAADLTANPAPRWITVPATSLDLANDGSTAVTLTGVAVDENFPVRYSWDGYSGSSIFDASSLPPQLASAPVINQSTGVTSLVGSSTSSNAGTYYHRTRATDGINTTTQTTEVNLQFIPTSGMTGWYDAATSTIGTSGGQPTISDVSGNNNNLGVGVNTPIYSATGFANKPSLYSGTGGGYIDFDDADYSGGSGVGSMYLIMTNEYTNDYQAAYINNAIPWILRNHGASSLSAMSYSNSGTTNAVLRVNKTDVPNPTAAGSNPPYDTLIDSYTDRLHSIGITNVDFGSSGVRVFGGSSLAAVGHFRAILFYNRNLSNAEMDQLHDYYKGIYGSDMA